MDRAELISAATFSSPRRSVKRATVEQHDREQHLQLSPPRLATGCGTPYSTHTHICTHTHTQLAWVSVSSLSVCGCVYVLAKSGKIGKSAIFVPGNTFAEQEATSRNTEVMRQLAALMSSFPFPHIALPHGW